MAATASKVLNIARGWLGYSKSNGKYKEILNVYNAHKPLARNYKMTTSDPWCACFVSACAIKAGAVDIIGTEVSCTKLIEIFKKKGIWYEDGNMKPRVGDIILFNWDDMTQPNDGSADHVGFVEQVNGNTIICIEGNYSNKVGRRTINRGWGYIRGYARPKYAAEPATNNVVKKKSIDTVAREVIKGAWGSGVARKTALTKAGYNYEAVQKKVNEILAKGATKSVTAVAKEVIAGKWGSGVARKTALTKAGYDYEAVQKKVNELL